MLRKYITFQEYLISYTLAQSTSNSQTAGNTSLKSNTELKKKKKWLVISHFKEWENQGNFLYQISLQISVCQRFHHKYQFFREAFPAVITRHTLYFSTLAFFTLAAVLHVDSVVDCISLALKLRVLLSTEFAMGQTFSKQFANIYSLNHHNNPVK